MASAGDTSQVLNERLKCHKCKSGLRAGKLRWSKCLKNHLICQDCRFDYCSCGNVIVEEHCPIIEELLKAKTMRFTCKNESRGCNESYGEEAMISHELECIYRMVKCARIHCDFRVPFHELLEHMKEKCYQSPPMVTVEKDKKQIYTRQMSEKSFEKESSKNYPVKIEFDGRVFLFFSGAFRSDKIMHFWIQLVGSKFEAKNYYYTLEFHCIDPNASSTFTAQVIPIDERWKSIADNKDFTISFGNFKAQFMDENRFWQVSISIKNMKEEVKDDNVESGISDDE